MPLTKLQFRPGINRDITSYSNEGGWVDCDKVRFRLGYPEVIGGWEKYSSNTYLGTARALFNWVALDGSDFLGVGTHLKYYVEQGQAFYDVTPIRKTSTNSITFAATDGSSTITATDSSHGAVQGDFVTIAGITPDLQQLDVRLFSMLGVVVKQTLLNTATATQRVSTAGLTSGVYMVQIKSGNQTTVKKVIVK